MFLPFSSDHALRGKMYCAESDQIIFSDSEDCSISDDSSEDWTVSSLSHCNAPVEQLAEEIIMRGSYEGRARMEYVMGNKTPPVTPRDLVDDLEVPLLQLGDSPPWQWIGGRLHFFNCDCETCESVPETSSESEPDDSDDENASPMNVSFDDDELMSYMYVDVHK